MAQKSEFWILSNYNNCYKYLLLTKLKTNTYDLFIIGTIMSNVVNVDYIEFKYYINLLSNSVITFQRTQILCKCIKIAILLLNKY